MLSLQNLGYEIGDRVLFQDANWNLVPGHRYGLVGRNGTGKTTLLKLIAGDLQPSSGSVQRANDAVVGFLKQELLEQQHQESILHVAMEAFRDLRLMEAQLEALLAVPAEGQTDDWLLELTDLQERFGALGGYEMEAKAHAVLAGLGFPEEHHHRPFVSFSGGWRMRVHLASLLLQEPDVLLLDEPTNHLDLPSIRWLEQYLQRFKGSVVLVSHDREFLDRLVTHVVELNAKRLHFYTGNYSRFEEEKEMRRELHMASFENQQKYIQDTERFIERFRAKATKASQAQSRIKALDRLERIEAWEDDAPAVKFRFRSAEQPGREVLRLAHFNKAYGDLVVLADADALLERGDKVGLVGPNGIGKSTLLRILAGVEPCQGERSLGFRAKLAVFGQHQLEDLNPRNTIFEELKPFAYERGDEYVRTVLGGFLFRGDDIDKRIGVLSGGERSRVALARTLLLEANVLLLDEPTNHLDLPSIEVLAQALRDYPGTFVVVSHNRHFLRTVTNKVWYIEERKLKVYPGNYAEYEQDVVNRREADAKPRPEAKRTDAKPEPKTDVRPVAKPTVAHRQPGTPPETRPSPAASRPDRKALQNRLAKVERDIAQLEEQEQSLKAHLLDPAKATDFAELARLQTELDKTRHRLSPLMDEWANLSEQLAI